MLFHLDFKPALIDFFGHLGAAKQTVKQTLTYYHLLKQSHYFSDP